MWQAPVEGQNFWMCLVMIERSKWQMKFAAIQNSQNQKLHWIAAESPCNVEWWGCSLWCWEKQSNPGGRGSHLNVKCSEMGSKWDNVTWERDLTSAMNSAIGATLDFENGQKTWKQLTSRKRAENKLYKCSVWICSEQKHLCRFGGDWNN